ncbi:hypothetical protein [Streptomyces sp. DSM 40907]|uniref:hypothetical protein n=1 Tax=Streptomyces kutzneri TaxID=3051179 RepID=UPI0028D5430C|nr:hypothetical protein [Streptomyces sp. DSM 40907]
MSDDQHDEATADEATTDGAATAQPVAAKATQQAGRQTLETKSIQGQVITHTIVKPLK